MRVSLKKVSLAFLFGILIICASYGVSQAVVITPSLQQALQSAGPSGNVSVIINLGDKVDPSHIVQAVPSQNQVGGNEREHRRDAVVKALRDKADQTQGFLKALLQSRSAVKMTPLWITNSIAVTVPAFVISELMSMPQIESIELDAVIRAPAVVPTAPATPEWNISRINAPALWNAGITGAGVVVANLDTGVDATHPDLGPKWRGGACATPPNCDSWFDPYNNTTQPYDNAGSSTGHGTGTMGIMIGGSASNAYGVAPGATWIAVKIFNDAGSAVASDILQAFQWLLAPGGTTANAPDVVNNSWGFDGSPNVCDTSYQAAVQSLKAAEIAVVFSAGNKGPGTATSVSPANNKDVFAVGATDSSNTIALISSRGPSPCPDRTTSFPNVVAPGVGIYTSALAGGYQSGSGTSFAAPHVAGAMALLASAFPTLTPAQMETALEQTALPLGAPVPNDTYGYGLIDVSGALSYVTRHGNISIPEIAGYVPFFDYVGVTVNTTSAPETFTITNRSGGGLTVNSLILTGANFAEFSISADTCTGISLAASGSCTFAITFTPVSAGPKSAQISISYGSLAAVYFVSLSGNNPIARVQGTAIVATYSVVQTAYDNCASGDIIKMQATTFSESPGFNSPLNIAVSLQGGYDPAFTSQVGFTTIHGTLTIGRGTVTVGNVIVQ